MGQKTGSSHPANNTAPSAMRILTVLTILTYCVVVPGLWPPTTVLSTPFPERLRHFQSILLRKVELWNPLPYTSASPLTWTSPIAHLMDVPLFSMCLGAAEDISREVSFSLSPQYLAHFQNMVLWSRSICWTNDCFCLVPTLSASSQEYYMSQVLTSGGHYGKRWRNYQYFFSPQKPFQI